MVQRIRNVIVRRATLDDMLSVYALAPERIEELAVGPGTLGAALALTDDMIVAYGKIQLFAELVIATNKSASSLTQARAIQVLMGVAVQECKGRPIDELHAFTNDSRYADFLKSKLGFSETPEKALAFQLR
jgi:hypothetical protein